MKIPVIATRTLLIIWTIICFAGGMILLDWLLELYPRETSIFIPLYFMLWVVALYLGHSTIAIIIRWVNGH